MLRVLQFDLGPSTHGGWTMAMQSDRAGSLALGRGGPEIAATEKPKRHEELGLCLALIVLLGWALYVGLGGVDWSAVGHTFRALVAWIA